MHADASRSPVGRQLIPLITIQSIKLEEWSAESLLALGCNVPTSDRHVVSYVDDCGGQ